MKKVIEILKNATKEIELIESNTYNIPKSQLALIQKALYYYTEQSGKFNCCPTDSEAYEIFDMNQLCAMMNYKITIEISEEQKNRFAKHGMDFPIYNQ